MKLNNSQACKEISIAMHGSIGIMSFAMYYEFYYYVSLHSRPRARNYAVKCKLQDNNDNIANLSK